MYSSRQAKILSMCLLRDDYMTYHEISEELQMSSRTAMREINQIKDSLQNYHLQLISKKGKGILIIGSDEDKQNLIMDIQGSKIDYMDKKERQELLCFELLRTKDIQKLFYYSHKFQVSEATISHDLDDLETFFKKFHITLIRKPGFGVGIQASENDMRKALSTLINHTVQHHIMDVDFDRYNIQDVIEQMTATQNPNMKKILDNDILKNILEVFKTHHQELQLDSIAKSSYLGLLIHLMIAVHRIQDQRPLTDHQEIFQLITDQNAYQRAKAMAQYLSEAFQITFEETECVFIAIHLQSARQAMIQQNVAVEEFNDVIMKMLTVFEDNGYHLYGDYELYQSLAAHLKPALVRLEYNLSIYNPMLTQIQENFSEIYELTKKACVVFQDIYGYDVNDDEIGYLALHFAAAIERYQVTNLRHIRVGIICSSGIGLSALLMARLKRVVDQNVHLMPLSISEMQQSNCELFISTFDIENAILVTPLLNHNDVINVLKAIEDRRQKPSLTQQPTVSYNLIALADLVKTIIRHLKLYIIPHYYTKNEVIEFACHNVTLDSLLQQQIQERERKGSNVYPTFGLALLHTSTALVDQCLVHVIRPDNNEFSGTELEKVQVILFMLIPQDTDIYQQKVMSHISSQLIDNDEFFTQLKTGNEDNLKNIFSEILQAWMIQMIKEAEQYHGTY